MGAFCDDCHPVLLKNQWLFNSTTLRLPNSAVVVAHEQLTVESVDGHRHEHMPFAPAGDHMFLAGSSHQLHKPTAEARSLVSHWVPRVWPAEAALLATAISNAGRTGAVNAIRGGADFIKFFCGACCLSHLCAGRDLTVLSRMFGWLAAAYHELVAIHQDTVLNGMLAALFSMLLVTQDVHA